MRKAFLVLLAAGQMSGCSGDSDSTDFTLLGIWDAVYNLTADSCGIVAEGDTGFLDEQTVADAQPGTSLTTLVNFAGTLSGAEQPDGRTLFSGAANGDLFGDGTNCDIDQSISYEDVDPKEGKADSLFLLRIACNDGFTCETRALGSTVKRTE